MTEGGRTLFSGGVRKLRCCIEVLYMTLCTDQPVKSDRRGRVDRRAINHQQDVEAKV